MKKILLIFVVLLSLTASMAQDYSKVYMIGGATSAGWDLASAVGMSPVEFRMMLEKNA